MTRVLAVLAAVSLLVLLAPREVVAAPPVPCPPDVDEVLALRPTFATFNGEAVTRSPQTGRYATDAGFEFDHEFADVTAVRGAALKGCSQPAGQVTLVVIDPFTGARRPVTLEVRP